MQTATDAMKVMKEIEDNAKTSSNEPRMARVLNAGDIVRQGDIYCVALPHVPNGKWTDKGWKAVEDAMTDPHTKSDAMWKAWKQAATSGLEPRADHQLALGTSTGSRHVLEPNGERKLWNFKQGTPILGPVFEIAQRGVITHPEHAHVDIPSGVCAVIYQTDVASEELRAVRD